MGKKKVVVKVCEGIACEKRFSQYTRNRAEGDKELYNLENVEIVGCPCQGNCENGPTVIVETEGKPPQTCSRVTAVEMGSLIKKIKNQ